MERKYELKVQPGAGKAIRVVVWSGENGVDAAERYVSGHPNDAVIAIRDAGRVGLYIGIPHDGKG